MRSEGTTRGHSTGEATPSDPPRQGQAAAVGPVEIATEGGLLAVHPAYVPAASVRPLSALPSVQKSGSGVPIAENHPFEIDDQTQGHGGKDRPQDLNTEKLAPRHSRTTKFIAGANEPNSGPGVADAVN